MRRKFRFTGESYDLVRNYSAPLNYGGHAQEIKEEEKPACPDDGPKTEEAEVQENTAVHAADKRTVVTRTDVGRVRKNNQDAVINTWPLIGVADGMGGHKGGEVASSSARDLLVDLLLDKEPDEQLLRRAIQSVNYRLFVRQSEDDALTGMGTTLTVLWVDKDDILIGHVGDSRAYRLRDGKLEQITQDHSMVAEMVRQGVITPEQASTHPMRNVITRAVGTEDEIEVDVLREERRPGDIWLVCSDGLYGMVGDNRMTELILEDKPEIAADELLHAALEAGGRDNVSLVLMQDEEAAE